MAHHFADASWKSHEFLEAPYMRVPKEIGCALMASALVSPIVSMMDKAMVQPITGVGPFLGRMKDAGKVMVLNPGKFFGGLSFRLTSFVYFGTFAVANLSEAVLDFYNVKDDGKRKQVKVSAASAANISLLAWRDSVFAREYSGIAGAVRPKKTPMRTVSMFALRDFFTMAATFYGAPLASNYLIKEHDWNHDAAELSMALAVPVVSQLATAPIHIHAMDYYNRSLVSTSERFAQIKAEYSKVAFARSLRILPAFGLGSYANNKFRELSIRQPNEDLLFTKRVTKLIQRVTRPTNSESQVAATSPKTMN